MTPKNDIVSHHFICDFIARPSNYWYRLGWKKTLNETKMCEIHTCNGRDILNIYMHITLAVVIRMCLCTYISVQEDINI